MLVALEFPSENTYINGIRSVMVIPKAWLMTLLVVITISACKQDADIQETSLYGKWDIVQADRNGKPTPYLRGGYFVMEKGGTMAINITGSDEKGPYVLNDKVLRFKDSKEFTIESVKADSMRIRYRMNQDSEFLFYLHKKANEN
jgi:hypothetical protein